MTKDLQNSTHQIKYFTKESKKYQTRNIVPWQKRYNSRIGEMIGKGKNAIVVNIGARSGYVVIYLDTKVKKEKFFSQSLLNTDIFGLFLGR